MQSFLIPLNDFTPKSE